MNSLLWIILDSCRHDSLVRARTPNLDLLAAANRTCIERRWSYASWTAPAHCAFLMGLVPHENRPDRSAGDVFSSDLRRWSERLGVDIDFGRLLPHLSLPRLLGDLGYRTVGRVAMPVLNESTWFAADFDDYRLGDWNGFDAVADELFPPGSPATFAWVNVGETHYPYRLADAPHLAGLHGVCRRLASGLDAGGRVAEALPSDLAWLHEQQVRAVEHVDRCLGRLLARCPPKTHVIVTADHGELFGEGGFFGHGPVVHEKVFEVPFLEGKIPDGWYDDRAERVPENLGSPQTEELRERLRSLGYMA